MTHALLTRYCEDSRVAGSANRAWTFRAFQDTVFTFEPDRYDYNLDVWPNHEPHTPLDPAIARRWDALTEARPFMSRPVASVADINALIVEAAAIANVITVETGHPCDLRFWLNELPRHWVWELGPRPSNVLVFALSDLAHAGSVEVVAVPPVEDHRVAA